MGDERASLISTDPPYGVDYTGVARPKSKEGKTKGKDWTGIYNEIDIENYGQFLKDVFGAVSKFAKPRCAWYVWYADRRRREVDDALESVGVRVHQQIVWVKPAPVATYSCSARRPPVMSMGLRSGHVTTGS